MYVKVRMYEKRANMTGMAVERSVAYHAAIDTLNLLLDLNSNLVNVD